VWRLPLILLALAGCTAAMDILRSTNAQFAVNALNESLGAAVPDITCGVLAAPSFLAVFHHSLHEFGVWGSIAAVAWLMRTKVMFHEHNATNSVDIAGQRLALALWTPKILVGPHVLVLETAGVRRCRRHMHACNSC
jgi:hypothetical protein